MINEWNEITAYLWYGACANESAIRMIELMGKKIHAPRYNRVVQYHSLEEKLSAANAPGIEVEILFRGKPRKRLERIARFFSKGKTKRRPDNYCKEKKMPIRSRYEKELKDVTDNLVLMCRHIETAIEKCVRSLTSRDFEIAKEVYEEEKLIDSMEREIEQSCLRILLMEHPVANDFHEVTAALKMITDLERIGDQTRDIAEIAAQFGGKEYIKKLEHIPQMAVIVIQMVKDGVQAYINRDLELARSLDKSDDKVDNLFRIVTNDLIGHIRQNPDNAEQAMMFMMIAKYFERIGDHAVNIGEWVEYAITGSHRVNSAMRN